MKYLTLAAALSAAAFATTPAPAADASVKVATGLDYSTGEYGDTESTDMLYVPVILSYRLFPFTAKLTVPYLQIDGPGNVVAGVDGGVVTGESSVERRTESGLGDVVVAAMYSIDPWTDAAPMVDFTAKAKLPTADDDKDLGTGAADYSLQVELARAFGDWTPFVTLGYQFMGQPDDFELDDRAYFSLGTDAKVNDTLRLGGGYDFKQAASATSDDASELMGYASIKLAAGTMLNLYGVKGLSDGSPDWGAGAQVSRRF
jgi:hypothetical protein